VVVNALAGERAAAAGRRGGDAVVWHDLECGGYAADLPLWRALARAHAPGPGDGVLDVGAGTGRVALELARAGHRVTALDRDARLLAALRERAGRAARGSRSPAGAGVQTVCADARAFALDERGFALCLVPMQTLQLLGGARGRAAFFACARAHLRAGGALACAIVTRLDSFDAAAGDGAPQAERARVAGRLYTSRAVRVQVRAGSARIERVRRIAPASVPARAGAPGAPSPAQPSCERDVVELDLVGVRELQREGERAGLRAAGTRGVPETAEHVGSVVVLFDA